MDFPEFVPGLVNGVFQSIVDGSRHDRDNGRAMWISDRLFAPAAAVLRPGPVRLERPAWTGRRRNPHAVLWSASLLGPPAVSVVHFVETPEKLVWSRARKTHEDRHELTVRPTLWEGFDVYGFVSGWCTALHGISARPLDSLEWLLSSTDATCGSPLVLMTSPGEPPVRCGVLPVAKEDVLFRRVGLWGLHPAVRARLPEPLASVLTWRRHGTVSATDLP